MDQPNRDTAYLLAAQHDDKDMLRAFQKSPGATPLVTPELRRRADAERARRLDPIAYQRFVEIGELLEHLQMLALEIEDVAKAFQVDVTKLPLTDNEINDRIEYMIEATFGRDMFMKVTGRKDAAEQAFA